MTFKYSRKKIFKLLLKKKFDWLDYKLSFDFHMKKVILVPGCYTAYLHRMWDQVLRPIKMLRSTFYSGDLDTGQVQYLYEKMFGFHMVQY